MMRLLGDEVPSCEALFQEEELPPLNLKSIIDCVSSIPLYDRLNIDKVSLSENETKAMDLLAEKYNDNVSNLISDKKLETYTDDFHLLESEYSQVEEFPRLFLKNLYNCSENDELLIKLKENISFDGFVQDSTNEVELVDESEPYTPSKEFVQFFLNTNDGIHDNLIFHKSLSLHDSSSDVSSDENVEIREDKIKELSHKLKFCDSSNSRFLEPIISINKPSSVFEIIPECNKKMPILKKNELFLSDSESENALENKNLVEVDRKHNIPLGNQIKKDKLKKKSEKKTRDRGEKMKKACELKAGEKKGKEKILTRIHSNVPSVDLTKSNLDKITISDTSANQVATSAASLNVMIHPSQSHSNANIKCINKKQINDDESSSGDEDWEGLAQKNVFLRSKTFGQKNPKKK